DFASAATTAGRAIELDPRLAAAWDVRGAARLSLGDRPGARRDLDEALRLDPRSFNAWGHSARLSRLEGDHARSLREAERAIEVAPCADAWLLGERGFGRLSLGDVAGAARDFDAAVAL